MNNQYWNPARMPLEDELSKLEKLSYFFFQTDNYPLFSDFVKYADRPFGNKDIEQSIAYNMGFDPERRLTKEHMPDDFRESMEKLFEEFKIYIEKETQNCERNLISDFKVENFKYLLNRSHFYHIKPGARLKILMQHVINKDLGMELIAEIKNDMSLLQQVFIPLSVKKEYFYEMLVHYQPKDKNEIERICTNLVKHDQYESMNFMLQNIVKSDINALKQKLKLYVDLDKLQSPSKELNQYLFPKQKDFEELVGLYILISGWQQAKVLLDKGYHIPDTLYEETTGEHVNMASALGKNLTGSAYMQEDISSFIQYYIQHKPEQLEQLESTLTNKKMKEQLNYAMEKYNFKESLEKSLNSNITTTKVKL